MGIVIGSCVAQESATSAFSNSSTRMLSPPRRQTLMLSVIDRHSDSEAEPVQINRFRSHSTFSLVSDLSSSFHGYQPARIMYGTNFRSIFLKRKKNPIKG